MVPVPVLAPPVICTVAISNAGEKGVGRAERSRGCAARHDRLLGGSYGSGSSLIWDFSSHHNTIAFSGGKVQPIRRYLGLQFGSVENEVSAFHGSPSNESKPRRW